MAQKLPPGPRLPSLIQGVGFWTRPLSFFERARARYGGRFTVRLPFSPPFVHHTDPEHVKEIYTAPPDVLHPGRGARVLTPLVGQHSVILLDEDEHMEQRKLMLPAFHGERMERLTELIRAVTEEEISGWRTQEVELHPRFQALTLEIIMRAVFGFEPGPRLDALRTSLAALLSYGDSPMTLISPPEDPGELKRAEERFNKFGPLKGFLDRRREVDAILAEEIADRRASADEDSDDVLSMLLAARHEDGTPMSAEELRDELMTLLVAGHETTASSLAWLYSRIAHEPRVLAELRRAADAEGEAGSYVTATIQETLRRRPVLPVTAPRYVNAPIEVGGWEYPTEVCLVANAYLLHHDPAIYPDPYEFRPERFLDEKPGTYTWIPFGGGRRRCLGSSFALLEMRIVVAEIARRFDIAPGTAGPELSRRRNITIYPKDGARVALRERERVPVAA